MLSMTNRRLFLRGFTLTEILVSSIIVSFVFVGVMTAQYAVMKMGKDQTRETRLYMELAAVAERIRFDATKAVGDATNYGIRYSGDGRTPALAGQTMCFRKDTNNTPAEYVYPGDKWSCYTLVGNNLHFCESGNANPVDCGSGDPILTQLAPDTFNTASCSACYPPDIDSIDNYFEFQLVNRKIAGSNAAVSAGALTTGTADNPQVAISYRVFPEAHSF